MPKISDEARQAARQRLIDATIAVVERDGADGLTTRAITTEAGVSAGMFYGHFESKEALIEAVVDSKVHELATVVAAEIDLGRPLQDVLVGFVRELFRFQGLTALAFFRSSTNTPDLAEFQRQVNRRIVDAFVPVVSAGVAGGLLRDDIDPEAIVELIDVALDGLVRRRIHDTFATSDDRLTTTILAVLEQFLLVPQGAQDQ